MPAALWASAILLAAMLCGCGSGSKRARISSEPSAPPALERPRSPAFGLTEDNANLLRNPGSDRQPPAAFRGAQSELTALHPTYLRLVIDWSTLQPSADKPPALALMTSGCARQIAPCAAYEGIRAELEAIASQQQKTGGFQVVLDIFGVPTWAARSPSGCEKPGTGSFSRPLRAAALSDYRTLVGSLLALSQQQGVRIDWWSPWNEPNQPFFISPQRGSCSSSTPAVSASIYAELAEAMAGELASKGSEDHLLLGELAGYTAGGEHHTSVSEFLAALPAQVICMSDVWSVHSYASTHGRTLAEEPVQMLERALDRRGSCGRSAQIWITETGTGAAATRSEPDAPPSPGVSESQQREGCRALAARLAHWYRDPRVKAIFQYTFREDPDFPVGLISADLTHLFPSYALWSAWSRALATGGPAPALPAQCS